MLNVEHEVASAWFNHDFSECLRLNCSSSNPTHENLAIGWLSHLFWPS